MSADLSCWHCGATVPRAALTFEAVLVPRSEGRGGPVLTLSCRECGVRNVAERNRAREVLLVPPPRDGIRDATIRGPVAYAAKKWARDHAAERAEFLGREAPARPAVLAPEPPEAEEPEPEEARKAPGSAPSGVSSVLRAYEVLGLPLTAGADEIRRRYRELAKKSHPDRVADLDPEIRRTAKKRFLEIRRAYEALENL